MSHTSHSSSQPLWIRWLSEINLVPSSFFHHFPTSLAAFVAQENWNQCSWHSAIIRTHFFLCRPFGVVRLYCGCCNYVPCRRMCNYLFLFYMRRYRLDSVLIMFCVCCRQKQNGAKKKFSHYTFGDDGEERCCRWDWHHMRPRPLFHRKTHAWAPCTESHTMQPSHNCIRHIRCQ